MSQEPTDDLVVYLGLQDFTVDSVEVRAAPRLGDAGRRIKIVHVSNRSGRHQCRDCGRHVERGLFAADEFEHVGIQWQLIALEEGIPSFRRPGAGRGHRQLFAFSHSQHLH